MADAARIPKTSRALRARIRATTRDMLRGLVPRNRRIRYQGCDENGEPIERTVSGFHARVVQHECDHLEGTLFIDHISTLKRMMYDKRIAKRGK